MARKRTYRRRRTTRKGMRRRTSRRAYIKRGVGRRVKSNWGKISMLAGTGAFLQQVTAKDMHTTSGQPIANRAQGFVNALVGRITGYNPFPATGQVPQTINPEGMFNKWSGSGLAMILYGMVPVKFLPHKGKAKTLGKSLLTGGILGGLFDAPSLSSRNLISNHRTVNPSMESVSTI